MRSPQELQFRLRQELANLRLYAFPPSITSRTQAPLKNLPDPGPVAARLVASAYAKQVARAAELVRAGRIPLLGRELVTGKAIAWRRDLESGKESGLSYFPRIPYLNASIVGDHKFIWELSRHQYLVAMAQMYLFSGDASWVRSIEEILEDWDRENPFHRGINWSSALEVAFRALSWIWVYHFAGSAMSERGRARLIGGLYRHGLHLEYNLSVYFSPNTHLLGEAVALHAIGRLFPDFPRAKRWEDLGARTTREQMERQVAEDGSHFEQSTYYHVYAMDLFLLHHILSEGGAGYEEKLARMARFLSAVCGPDRLLPMIGDEDGGRLFHPYGEPGHFGRATLATCGALLGSGEWAYMAGDIEEQAAWWLGERVVGKSCPGRPAEAFLRFPQSGIIVNERGGLHIVFDAGEIGSGSGGHSHADALSVVVRHDGEELLTDRGTFTYVGDLAERDRFRGAAAHNTVRVAGCDQATPAGPFRWKNKPAVKVRRAAEGYIDALCQALGYTHRRRMLVVDNTYVVVVDQVESAAHEIEIFWHPRLEPERVTETCFRIGTKARLLLSYPARIEPCWHSPSYGKKKPAWTLVASSAPGTILAAVIDLNGVLEVDRVEVRQTGESLVIQAGAWCAEIPGA